MSKRKIPERDELIQALTECEGNMAATARRFHCDRRTVWHHVNDDVELRELVDELSQSFLDEAESQLFTAIKAGNLTAVIFFLKTRGRGRGYNSERVELSANVHIPYEIVVRHTNADGSFADGSVKYFV